MTKNDSDYTAKFTIGERVKVVDNVGIIGHGRFDFKLVLEKIRKVAEG